MLFSRVQVIDRFIMGQVKVNNFLRMPVLEMLKDVRRVEEELR